MAPNKYMLGAAGLASPPREFTGWSDWDFNYNAAANQYWKQQRQQQRVSPAATFTQQRQMQGQQLRDVLLQQQAANTASLRAQLAQMGVPAGAQLQAPPSYAPAPSPSYEAQDSAPSQDDWSSQGPQDDVVGAFGVATPAATFGASAAGAAVKAASSKFPPGNYVVVRVKNMPDVIRSQSALGKLALMGAPKEIEKVAYGKMAEKMQAGMADEGVDAEVSVTEQPPTKTSGSDLVTGAVMGASGVGLIWLLVKLIGKRR